VQGLETAFVQCPYCGEAIELVIDRELIGEDYIEDCSVCCRPITLTVSSSDGESLSIEARTADG